jgi:hypothetical protein
MAFGIIQLREGKIMAKERLYVVSDWGAAANTVPPAAERLVWATSQARAVSHCARRFTARVANPSDVLRLTQAGVTDEHASASDELELGS